MKTIIILLMSAAWLSAQTMNEFTGGSVDSLIQVSRSFTDKQEFSLAIEVGQIAEKKALANAGRQSALYGSACFNLGRVYYFQGKYEEAENWYLEAKAIREKVLGKYDTEYGKSVNNLAILYDEMSQYEKAEPLYLEAISIREKAYGKESAAYAASLANLAGLYRSLGKFEQAETFNLTAKDIREKILGKSDPAYASSLNNLANLYFEMGIYKKAERLYLESIAIREAAGDTESPDYLSGLDNLGILYREMSQYDTAEKYLLEAKAIREKVLGDQHPQYITSLTHLAALYQEKMDYSTAESHFLLSKNIGAKILGLEHPDYALILLNLGALYYDMSLYEKAELHLSEAKYVFEKSIGKDQKNYSHLLQLLANTYWASKKLKEASVCMTEEGNIERLLLNRAARHLSETELSHYTQEFYDKFSQRCSFAHENGQIVPDCYNDILFYKGFLLNAVYNVRNLSSSIPEAAEKQALLKSFQRRLAFEYSKPKAERQHVEILEGKANDIEKELIRSVAGIGEGLRQVGWEAVQQNLKPDEVAIEFVRYDLMLPKPTDSVVYAALVLLPSLGNDNHREPRLIPLFEEKELDKLLDVNNERKMDYVNGLYSISNRGIIVKNKPQKSLYELIWQPLEKELSGVKLAYYSPAGLLHRLNLAAISIDEEQTLADRLQLVQLKSTRQLAFPVNPGKTNNKAVLYGGIHFDRDTLAQNKGVPVLEDKNRGNSKPLATETSIQLTVSSLEKNSPLNHTGMNRGGHWRFLPGSKKEIDSLGQLLPKASIQLAVKKGYEGTEESFKMLGSSGGEMSPRIIHLATHGYFFPDPQKKPESVNSGTEDHQSVFSVSDQPMFRSGLILSGGNATWQGAINPGYSEDGILTAYEISHMNLSNTELVVLSACETGLGDIQGNEGVYGLQRAFKIAGVKYLIMSLWQVPDRQTGELMTVFYRKWLIDKLTIPEAFHSAQQEMRERFVDPYVWAGFVLLE